MFKIFKKKPEIACNLPWVRSWTDESVLLRRVFLQEGTTLEGAFLDGFLTQLVDDGHATAGTDGYSISWDELYAAAANSAYPTLTELLALPPYTLRRQALRSSNSLIDKDFSIVISGWFGADGSFSECECNGPVISGPSGLELMQAQQWQLLKEVTAFYRRTDSQRTEFNHRQSWGRLRKLAVTAGARLDDFLFRSVVLSPDRLEIGLRRSEHVIDDRVIEVEPGFQGAPADWLKVFDNKRV
jgi:hypothetical protein